MHSSSLWCSLHSHIGTVIKCQLHASHEARLGDTARNKQIKNFPALIKPMSGKKRVGGISQGYSNSTAGGWARLVYPGGWRAGRNPNLKSWVCKVGVSGPVASWEWHWGQWASHMCQVFPLGQPSPDLLPQSKSTKFYLLNHLQFLFQRKYQASWENRIMLDYLTLIL